MWAHVAFLLVSTIGTKVKVATGWGCGQEYFLDSLSGTSLDACESACNTTCSAFSYKSDESCTLYSACPVVGRRLMVSSTTSFNTYITQISPLIESSDIWRFSGSSDDSLLFSFDTGSYNESWTVDALVYAVSGREQVVLSNQRGKTGFGLCISDGRWVVKVGNTTDISVVVGSKVLLHVWNRVVMFYSSPAREVTLEVDGSPVAILDDISYTPPVVPELWVGRGAAVLPFIGKIREFRIYTAVLDTAVLNVMSAGYVDCEAVEAPNIGMATTHAHADYGASHFGMCLYLGHGDETCHQTCARLTGGRCDLKMSTISSSSSACASAMQRLGMYYTSLTNANNGDGCVWGRLGQTTTFGKGNTCGSRPVGRGVNDTLRVCACESDETATRTSIETCGSSGDYCSPCPEMIFNRRPWAVISSDSACDNATVATSFYANVRMGLGTCRDRCEGLPSCAAINYFGLTGLCEILEEACEGGAVFGNGSSSHRLLPAVHATCSSEGTISETALTEGTVCACRDYCSGINAAYGDFRSNGTCRCYSSCTSYDLAPSVGEVGPECVGCSNITTFYVRSSEEFKECLHKGVQLLNTPSLLDLNYEATTANISGSVQTVTTRSAHRVSGSGDLGTAPLGGDGGLTYSAWYRKENLKIETWTNTWRITNLQEVVLGWDLCEIRFYEDNNCLENEMNTSFSVHSLPFTAVKLHSNSSVTDGDPLTCMTTSCGEFASGMGCSPRVASFVFEFDREVNFKCLMLYQYKNPLMASNALSIERFTTGGTWQPMWQCYYIDAGKWQGCSEATGLYVVWETTNWELARQGCSQRGGDLVTIRSEAVNKAALKMLNGSDGWIGAYREDSDTYNKTHPFVDATSNTFKWVDETSWEWFTPTMTLTGTDGRATGKHNDRKRDYANWECGGGHPRQATGDCAFIYSNVSGTTCAQVGEWGPKQCELSVPAYVCNISSPQASDANGTRTETFSPTFEVSVVLPEVLFSCGNAAGDDTVLLVVDYNSTTLRYSVARSIPSNWPDRTTSTYASYSVPFQALSADSDYHHVAVLHKSSGVVSLLYDFEPIEEPFASSTAAMNSYASPTVWLAPSTVNYTNVTNEVESWKDLSPEDNLVSPIDTATPVFVLNSSPHGKWASVYFGANETRTSMQLSVPPTAVGSGLTLFAVVKPTAAAALPHLLDVSSVWGLRVGMDKVTCFADETNGGASLTAWAEWNPPGDDGWILISCRVTFSDKMVLRINGHEAISQTISLVSLNISGAPSASTRLRARGPTVLGHQSLTADETGNYFTGYLAELLIYTTSLTDEGMEKIEEMLSRKYFGGVFVQHPARVPRGDCFVGGSVNASLGNFTGNIRDVVLWDIEKRRKNVVEAAVNGLDTLNDHEGVSRALGCTTLCVGMKIADKPVASVGYVSAMPTGTSVFEGYITVNTVPSGDQPILSFGGYGCGPGTLVAWAFPAEGGYGLALGEWSGSALRTNKYFKTGLRYRVRFEADPSIGTPQKYDYVSYDLLSFSINANGTWKESATQCGGGGHCVVAAEINIVHSTSILMSPWYIPTSSSSITVTVFGTPGTGADILGMSDVSGTGFAGVGLYDIQHGRYVAAKTRSAYGMNETGQEVLVFTAWEMSALSGRRIRVDLIDDYCTERRCSDGWIGFKRVTVNNANSTSASSRITVEDAVLANGRLTTWNGPLEAGEISLLARCHNMKTSGALDALVEITVGCPIHSTPPDPSRHDEVFNYSQVDNTPTPTATFSATQEADCGSWFAGNYIDYKPGGVGVISPVTFGGRGLSLSVWVRLTESPFADAKILDYAHAPTDFRVVLGFYKTTGSVVYQVQEYAPPEKTISDIGNPELGQLPHATGSEEIHNIMVESEYLMFRGCYSNASYFDSIAGREYGTVGGNLADNIARAVTKGFRYISLANTPSYEAAGRDGGAYFFNILSEAGDLTAADCKAVKCDSGVGICGCAGGGDCGTYAVQSERCPYPDNAVGGCALATQSWAVWERVFSSGPNIPVDGFWHHVGVIHKPDSGKKKHGVMPQGNAKLFIDHVHTHTSLVILPQHAIRYENFVGKDHNESSNSTMYLVGGVKEAYLWDGSILATELKAIAERTMVPTYPSAPLVSSAVQNCAVPDEGYGQCLSYVSRTRDPRMCERPLCECWHNGFRCAVSSWGKDYKKQRKWGESWGAVPLFGGSTHGVITPRAAHARCYATTRTPEGCMCEGDVTFFSFDPAKVTHKLTCQDVMQAFDGGLSPQLPSEVVVPSAAGSVLCPNTGPNNSFIVKF